MPVVAVNLSASVYEEVLDLIQTGEYSSPQVFLQTAAFNQLAMERDKHREPRAKATADPVVQPIRARAQRAISHSEMTEFLERVSAHAVKQLPTPVTATIRPHGERIWGQINRLFP